jgi:dTDP-4-amino-4,6-dideoxygalactose transaminase
MQPAYAGRLPRVVELPVTERIASEIVSLPIFPSLSDGEVDRVAEAVLEWAEGIPRIEAGLDHAS